MSEQQHPNPAEMYESFFGPTIADPWTRVLLEYAAAQPGERVLDLACGTGSVARHIAPAISAEGKVVALDVNPEMLAMGRAFAAPNGATIEWREGDAVALALPDEAFDLVVCQQGLQFFADRAASLRVLGGICAGVMWPMIAVSQAALPHPGSGDHLSLSLPRRAEI